MLGCFLSYFVNLTTQPLQTWWVTRRRQQTNQKKRPLLERDLRLLDRLEIPGQATIWGIRSLVGLLMMVMLLVLTVLAATSLDFSNIRFGKYVLPMAELGKYFFVFAAVWVVLTTLRLSSWVIEILDATQDIPAARSRIQKLLQDMEPA